VSPRLRRAHFPAAQKKRPYPGGGDHVVFPLAAFPNVVRVVRRVVRPGPDTMVGPGPQRFDVTNARGCYCVYLVSVTRDPFATGRSKSFVFRISVLARDVRFDKKRIKKNVRFETA